MERLAELTFFLSLKLNKNPVFMGNKNSVHLVYCVKSFLTKKDKTKLNTQGWLEDLISFPPINYKILVFTGL